MMILDVIDLKGDKMKKINSQRIELKGAGICQIDEDILIIKGKDLRCKERGNIFYII